MGNFNPFVPNGWFSVGNAITVIFGHFSVGRRFVIWLSTLKGQKKILSKEQLLVQLSLDYYFSAKPCHYWNGHVWQSRKQPVSYWCYNGRYSRRRCQSRYSCFSFNYLYRDSESVSLTQLGYSLSRDGAFPKFSQGCMQLLKFQDRWYCLLSVFR